MPCYEYKCTDEECGHIHEQFLSIADRKEKTKCPECGKTAKFIFPRRVTPVAHWPLGHPRVGRGRRDRSRDNL